MKTLLFLAATVGMTISANAVSIAVDNYTYSGLLPDSSFSDPANSILNDNDTIGAQVGWLDPDGPPTWSEANNSVPIITFTLGGEFDLNTIQFFTATRFGFVSQVDVAVSTTGTFGAFTSFTGLTGNPATFLLDVSALENADNAQFVQVKLYGDIGGQNRVNVYEVDFDGVAAPVPEPSSTALLGLGALALILRRRK